MKLRIDTNQVNALNKQLGIAGRVFDKQFLKPALKAALRPVADAAKREAPKRQRNGRFSTRTKSLSNSIRILIVDGEKPGEVRGLVGVSKKRGAAGYRASFTIKGATNRRTQKGYNRGSIPANDFLGRAERQGTPLVISSLSDSAQAVVRKALNRYL